MLLKQALTLMVNPLVRDRYSEIAERIHRSLLKNDVITDYLQEKLPLGEKEISELIRKSITAVTFTTLLGWDFGARISRLEALRGALVGASIGVCLVVGHLTFKLLIRATVEGLEVAEVEILEKKEEVTFVTSSAMAS